MFFKKSTLILLNFNITFKKLFNLNVGLLLKCDKWKSYTVQKYWHIFFEYNYLLIKKICISFNK